MCVVCGCGCGWVWGVCVGVGGVCVCVGVGGVCVGVVWCDVMLCNVCSVLLMCTWLCECTCTLCVHSHTFTNTDISNQRVCPHIQPCWTTQ